MFQGIESVLGRQNFSRLYYRFLTFYKIGPDKF
jgi:hypothetical protein